MTRQLLPEQLADRSAVSFHVEQHGNLAIDGEPRGGAEIDEDAADLVGGHVQTTFVSLPLVIRELVPVLAEIGTDIQWVQSYVAELAVKAFVTVIASCENHRPGLVLRPRTV